MLISLLIVGCETEFLEELQDYSNVGNEIYQDENLAKGYLDYMYNATLPPRDQNMAMYSLASAEHDDPSWFTRTTDEAAEETDFNIEWASISPQNDNCLRSIGSKLSTSGGRNDIWTRIRYSNLYLENIDDYDALDEGFVMQVKGQLYFWRAWNYFEMVRLYGGVPLVLTAQDPNIEDPENQIPRSTSGEVIDQIVSDLDMAYEMLINGRPYDESDMGRITAEACAALKGRVLLTWASPLFNRNDDQSRWQRAYEANQEAYNACVAAGKGLNPDWHGMFFDDYGMESIFSYGFNTVESGNFRKNNATERYSRPRDLGATGGNAPTKQIIDAFPMSDGTPYDPSGDLNDFYKDRDPRFYFTFSYNGAIWPYAENPDYKNWTYYWNTEEGGNPEISTENNPVATGVYLRKFANDNTSEAGGFRYVGSDYIEIRFAEVVLNLAESAIGAGMLQEGKQGIMDIRARAGIENLDGEYGLSSYTSRDQLFEAVINERKVEFAYENKRFYDLRRWLLFNDEYGMCTRLNQEPIDGMRRKGYYIVATNEDGSEYVGEEDPFEGDTAPIINRDTDSYPTGVGSYEEFVDYMYENHFEVRVRDDVDDPEFTFHWYDEYYFFGIPQELLDTAPYLEQTQGWGGSFDPLAE